MVTKPRGCGYDGHRCQCHQIRNLEGLSFNRQCADLGRQGSAQCAVCSADVEHALNGLRQASNHLRHCCGWISWAPQSASHRGNRLGTCLRKAPSTCSNHMPCTGDWGTSAIILDRRPEKCQRKNAMSVPAGFQTSSVWLKRQISLNQSIHWCLCGACTQDQKWHDLASCPTAQPC